MEELLSIIEPLEFKTWGEVLQHFSIMPMSTKDRKAIQFDLTRIQAHYRDLTLGQYYNLSVEEVKKVATYFKW